MKLFYHSDIMTIHTAFTLRVADSKNAHQIVEGLAASRLENPISKFDDSAAEQVALTLYAFFSRSEALQKGDPDIGITNIQVAPYKPEELNVASVRDTICDMCARGRFVPFIISVEESDVTSLESGDNTLVVAAGIGENPGVNFLVMTINMEGAFQELKITENTRPGLVNLMYPIVFDVTGNYVGSILSKEFIAVRTFILKKEADVPAELDPSQFELVNKEEVEDVPAGESGDSESENVQGSPDQ